MDSSVSNRLIKRLALLIVKRGLFKKIQKHKLRSERVTILTTPKTPSFLKRKGSARTTGEFIRYSRKASCQISDTLTIVSIV